MNHPTALSSISLKDYIEGASVLPQNESWTILVAGQWNAAIFSPTWVADLFKQLFQLPHIEVEFLSDASGTQVRYSTDRFWFMPHASRLMVVMKQIDEASLEQAERLVVHILEILPYTPVNAFGVNFGFKEENPRKALMEVFRLNDSSRLADKGYGPVRISIQRSIQIDGAILNAALTMSDEGTPIRIDLNFHHDVSNAFQAAERLKGNVVLYKSRGIDFLKTIYDLPWEEQ